MRSLLHAKSEGRKFRSLIETPGIALLDALTNFLFDHFQIEAIPVPAIVIDGGRAEVSPAEGVINYDEKLNSRPELLLWTLAHELGHLVLHKRLTDFEDREPDPLLGSAYLSGGVAALARYSKKSREEAEANAFANEFLCPATTLFNEWLADQSATSHTLSQQLKIPLTLIRAQLVEGLFSYVLHKDRPVENQFEKPKTKSHAAAPIRVNPKQLEAATAIGSPVLVNAGPGTGKTSTLVKRIEYLVTEKQARPDQILVLTFSNDAAEELRDRIAARFDESLANQVEISTFHGFGMSFLHSYSLGISQQFTLLDELGQEELINSLLCKLEIPSIINLRDLEETVSHIRRHIGYVKDRELNEVLITPTVLAKEIERWEENATSTEEIKKAREFQSAYEAYETAKLELHAVDFADLINLPVQEMQQNPELVTALRNKYRWVLVDEYQDVSRTVAMLLKLLCGPNNPPWVVGDMRQAIYRFRGAAPENVRDFGVDFPNSHTFELDTNYRSNAAIIEAANKLADLMNLGDSSNPTGVWQAGLPIDSIDEPAISVIKVNSDQTEYEVIAMQVRAWADKGVPFSNIAVLARRNIDVKNIVLALGRNGIPADISGLITAEGAAGDLVALLTLPESLRTSLPRLINALGKNTLTTERVTELTKLVVTHPTADPIAIFSTEALREVSADEFWLSLQTLSENAQQFDAFDLLASFLFDARTYLTKLFSDADATTQNLQLAEIISLLSESISFRFTHTSSGKQISRLRFAEIMRRKLNSSSTSFDVPNNQTDAVRVMTCHASKGLEFPCVIVSGQTLSANRSNWWLPDSLKPNDDEEEKQADSLLFVGLTRAKQAAVITFAESKSGQSRSRKRNIPSLLSKWLADGNVVQTEKHGPYDKDLSIDISNIWGGSLGSHLKARALDKDACELRMYLEDVLKLRFPVANFPMYGIFINAMRHAANELIRMICEEQRTEPVNTRTVLNKHFDSDRHGKHIHFSIYDKFGFQFLNEFKRSLQLIDLRGVAIEEQLKVEQNLEIVSDLVATVKATDEAKHAFLFRLESYKNSTSKSDSNQINWSGLSSSKRIPFVLLKDRFHEFQPWIYSATDQKLYQLKWSTRGDTIDTERASYQQRWQKYLKHEYQVSPNEFKCNNCPSRLICPYWLGSCNSN